MGDPDLSDGGSPPASLPDLIRAGDADAFAGFREAHIDIVRAYCEVACAPELVAEACDAAFLDFVGRLSADPAEQGLDAVLLAATRSAAARRFPAPEDLAVSDTSAGAAGAAAAADPPRGRRHPDGPPDTRICAAMPELLAARANGELRGDDDAIAGHITGCPVCAAGEARLQAAEAAFSTARGSARDTA